jgi:nucleotide-binding universal stress UspA family protein
MTQVIACIDGTAVSTSVSDHAAWASQRLEAPLVLLHVLDREQNPSAGDLSGNIGLGSRESLLNELAELDEKRGKLMLEQGRIMLDAAKERVMQDGCPAPKLLQRHGDLVETLDGMQSDTRLLVMGKHDENLGEHVGSRLESVVRALHRPILVCTPEFKPPRRILLAYDGSATTHKGIDTVTGSPLFRGLECHVVMVGDDTKANRGQLEWARHTLETQEFDVTTNLVNGNVERALCDYRQTHDIDLIVMGAYGHSVVRRFLVGSTTTCVLRNAQVPVLLLR